MRISLVLLNYQTKSKIPCSLYSERITNLEMRGMVSSVISNRANDFTILKSNQDLMIGGYASIEIVDKQNDLITLKALEEAVTKYMQNPKFRNVMTNHSNVQVGEV